MKIKKALNLILILILVAWGVASTTAAVVFYLDNKDKKDADNQTEESNSMNNNEEESSDTAPVKDWQLESKKLIEEGSSYSIDITYPVLEDYSNKDTQDDFNNIVKDIVDASADSTREASFDETLSGKNSVELAFEVKGKTDDFVSILLSGSYYAGGAHPGTTFAVINYDLKNNTEVGLSDLFKNEADYLTVISDYSIEKLKEKFSDGSLDDTIESGAGPVDDNFMLFNVTSKGLYITFGDYQVGPYAVGPQSVEIPYSKIKSLMNSELVID